MSDLEQKEPDEYCNARKTDGSGYCKHEAGWGTDHLGHGRCRYHGGKTPQQERGLLADLEDAAEHAAVAYRLQLKDFRRRLENGEEIDVTELDRLGRTAFDRTGRGPSEKHEVENTGDEALAEVVIDFSDVDT